MTSKMQPAVGYWTLDRENSGDEVVLFLVSRKNKNEMAKLLSERENILNE